MTPARFQTIEEIFRAALDQEPDQVNAFLETACEGDELLRRKVEALLASRQRVGSFIETSAAGIATRIIGNGKADLLVGQTIGHYKLSERIGIGGMGEVYLATDMTAGRKAALKLLPVRFTGDAERLKRFQQEARAVVGLNHPNILTVYEIGEDHSTHYIASELIEGETLHQRLMRGRIEVGEAVDVAIQVASALAAAHEADIVHRDIKPENIMLRPDGYVKVLDFGIAKLAESAFAKPPSVAAATFGVPGAAADGAGSMTLAETNLGSILGTVRYMSPEQACGAPVDKGTDIWSLGVVLYQMVTGHEPFIGDTPGEVMTSILEKEPLPLTSYIRQPPAELQQIISKTLRKDRGQRYHSAHKLLEALKDLRRKLEFESFFMSGFFDEVKRRKVYRVAAAYIIVAAGIIQLASAAFPAWELPNSAVRLVIVLLLIGFPLALILGWAFDVTPQGIRATPRAPPGTHRRRNMIMLVTTGVIISAAAGFFLLPRVAAHKVDKSIAVLPFENLSKDEENAYFAGGVQDEILTNLAKIADLKVISRTSVMQYKSGVKRNLKQIAQQLGVGHVVEGNVRRAGNQVRVSVQLIDARTDTHIWAEHYDRDVADVFAIQTEIAEHIVNQLQAKLSPAEKAAITERPTADPVAYAYYTQAKAMDVWSDWEGGAEKLLTRKVELLEKATQRDPNFALAYCALAKTQLDLDHATAVADSLDRTPLELAAKKAAETAVRVRPDLGEAHLELARYYYIANLWTGDFDRARDELVIARRTLPNNGEALVIGARIDKRQNRWDDALANFQKASELDPRNDEVAKHHRRTLREMRRYKEMEQLIAKNAASGLLRDPWTQETLAVVKLAQGDPVAAHALAAQVPPEFSPDGGIWWIRFTTALYLRDYDTANRVIAATPAKFTTYDGQSWADGQIARARGDNQKAQSVFAAARKWLDAATGSPKVLSKGQWEKHSQYFEFAARFDAGLGRKEEAIREARRAVDLMPIAKDSYWGPEAVENLALVYAWTGERDRALEQLEIVATIPTGPSYGDLKFNPCWDDLRGDPRFEKIVAAAKAASR
jgi:serine/threonine protein kinase/TolB-like protein/Tfp pilus assembly protein PilF